MQHAEVRAPPNPYPILAVTSSFVTAILKSSPEPPPAHYTLLPHHGAFVTVKLARQVAKCLRRSETWGIRSRYYVGYLGEMGGGEGLFKAGKEHMVYE